MKKLLTLLIIITLITGIFFIYEYQTNAGSKQKRLPARSPISVKVVPAQQKEIMQTIESIGTAKAFESVTITANVTEYVRKLYFDDGHTVKQGDILVELSSQEEKSRLQEAKAKLLEAQQQYDRITNLLKKSFSAKSEYDTQKANLESAKAQVDQYQSQLNDRVIKAPFDGILGFRQISVGTLLEPGDAVVTLDMINQLKVDFAIPEKLLTKIKKNQSFLAKSIAYPKAHFNGHIETIDARLDEASRSIMVRGIIDNQALKLKPGMLLKIELPIGKQSIIKIPESALLAQGKQRFIFIVKAGKAIKRNIKVIRRRGNEVDVGGDVHAKDLVVCEGAFKLRSGQEVTVVHAHQ